MFRSYSSARQMAALVVRKHLSTCTVDTAPMLGMGGIILPTILLNKNFVYMVYHLMYPIIN